MFTPPPPSELSRRLSLSLRLLREALAAHAGRNRAAAPIVLLVWNYLSRVAARFEALVNRVRAGQAAIAPRLHRPVPPGSASDHPARPRPARLPRGFAWLIRVTPEAAVFGSQLRHLLTDPEFAALLEAAPQAGRLLRPLCHMLGVGPQPGLPPTLFIPVARETPAADRPKWSPCAPDECATAPSRRRTRRWSMTFNPVAV